MLFEIKVGTGNLYFASNLQGLSNREGQSFLLGGKHTHLVWHQRPHPGKHVVQGLGDRNLQMQTRFMVRAEAITGPICRPECTS